jgi:hypothetical protein
LCISTIKIENLLELLQTVYPKRQIVQKMITMRKYPL